MKRVISCLLALLLYTPLAVAQAPSDESAPDEPEVPMIDLPPEQLPQPDMVLDGETLNPPFRSYSPKPTGVPAEPQAALKPPLSPSDIDQSKLPPGYTARWRCWSWGEEEVENGAALFGLEPHKVPYGDDPLYVVPKVCRQKEVAPSPPQPQPTTWESKLPSGYVARAVRCDEGEEEVENGAALFGLEPIKIRWDDHLVDWLPKVCRKKG